MKVNAKLYEILNERMKSEGWSSVNHFQKGSKVPFSVETVRRAFKDVGNDKNLEAATLAIICKYLNYNKNEIRDILKKYTDDKDFGPLIGDSNHEVSVYDDAIIQSINLILTTRPELTEHLANQIDLLGCASNVTVSSYTDILRRKLPKQEQAHDKPAKPSAKANSASTQNLATELASVIEKMINSHKTV